MAGLTRRQLLARLSGVGAVAVGGAGAVSAVRYHGLRRALHAIGIVAGPDRSVPPVDAKVAYGVLPSAFSPRPGYGLCVPSPPPEAVVYCLHGRGDSHRDVFDALGVDRSSRPTAHGCLAAGGSLLPAQLHFVGRSPPH